MQPTRDAARSLVKEGMIDVMQKGIVIGIDEEYCGPIRLRLCLDNDDLSILGHDGVAYGMVCIRCLWGVNDKIDSL